MVSGITRVFWISRVFVYLSLDDCLRLGGTCVHFNSLIKSPMFLKFIVKFHEKTKIDVSFIIDKTTGTVTKLRRERNVWVVDAWIEEPIPDTGFARPS